MEKITKKYSKNSNLVENQYVTNPFDSDEILPKVFTQKAIELYEKQADIKKYTKMVLQDEIGAEFLEDVSAELLLKGVFDPFQDESYKNLAKNEKLLDDLASDENFGG